MSQPHPLLFDLAAGRASNSVRLDSHVVDSAMEHRMSGLLHSAVLAGHVTGEADALALLQGRDIDHWARNRMLASVAGRLIGQAMAAGVGLALIKGVALEKHAYARTGERPTSDIDVVVAPEDVVRVPDFIGEVAPRHALLSDLADLISGGHVQGVDFTFEGIPIDLHVDPLKLEIASTRHPERFWDRVTVLDIEGQRIPSFDVEASLLLALVHLNKDRFRYLLGYADVVRLGQRTEDWGWVESTLEQEGIGTPAWETLRVVEQTLDIRLRDHPRPRSRVWRMAWSPKVRLLGAPGRVRYRYRQLLIPLLAGRWSEATGSLRRRLFPPDVLLRAYYPAAKGPYPWRLLTGRLGRRWQRRRQRRQAAAPESREEITDRG